MSTIQPHYKTGTDKAQFYCVFRGSHFVLASLSEHLKHKVPDDKFLLFDKQYRKTLAPKNEVAIGDRI